MRKSKKRKNLELLILETSLSIMKISSDTFSYFILLLCYFFNPIISLITFIFVFLSMNARESNVINILKNHEKKGGHNEMRLNHTEKEVI